MSRAKLWAAVERRAIAQDITPDQVAAALARRLDLRAEPTEPTVEEMLLEMGAQISISPYNGSWDASLCGERAGEHLYAFEASPREALKALRAEWVGGGSLPFTVHTTERADEIERQIAKRQAWTNEGRARDGSEDGR